MNTSITHLPTDHCDEYIPTDNTHITRENLHLCAQQGFTQLQQSLGRQNINPGDALLAFANCDASDKYRLTEYFCLTITMLNMTESKLNEIKDGVYKKLVDYIVKQYGEKLET
tara:strand:- start:1127 stop:1465 length:339 start_codon:yes stop_codon:yes gene_type:complete